MIRELVQEEIRKNLTEAPLPDDWDRSAFGSRSSFASMLRYAKERALQLGRGSSRVAFEIPYKGRKTALKIAINQKGIAQNQEEARLLSDWYLKSIGIVIPMIDYDESNGNRITWIHTEFAQKITQKQLERYFGGVSMDSIARYLDDQSGVRRLLSTPTLPQEIHDNEYFSALQDLVVNYNIPAADLARKANWGLYKGKPVIIDLGYTSETMSLY